MVAHFHFVLIGGLVFTIFGAIYYWFPKATGRMLSETLGRWHFWLFVIGFNLTFIPLHFAGVLGMPRRIYTYPADRGWDVWNLVATLGVPIQEAALLLFLINVVLSLRGANPPATTHGMPGRSSGRRRRHPQTTTSKRFPRSGAVGRCGTSSISDPDWLHE